MLTPACPVCEARKREFLCQDCINQELFSDKRDNLRPQQQRDVLQQRLEATLEKRVRALRQARPVVCAAAQATSHDGHGLSKVSQPRLNPNVPRAWAGVVPGERAAPSRNNLSCVRSSLSFLETVELWPIFFLGGRAPAIQSSARPRSLTGGPAAAAAGAVALAAAGASGARRAGGGGG